MAEFHVNNHYQPYIGTTEQRLDAIVSISSQDAASGSGDLSAAIGYLLDISGSMKYDKKLEYSKRAVGKALELLPARVTFFVAVFSQGGRIVVPPMPATPENIAAAISAIAEIETEGGTAMSTGLLEVRRVFRTIKASVKKLELLTDGRNEHEQAHVLEAEIKNCIGEFQCDVLGIGDDFDLPETQKIARSLLGEAGRVKTPGDIAARFEQSMKALIAQGVSSAELRIFSPKTSRLIACRQVSPTIVDLMPLVRRIDEKNIAIPTGSWGSEARDFQIAFTLQPGEAGEERMAARTSFVWKEGAEERTAGGEPIVAAWTEDDGLSAAIDPQVAHYSGQQELAEDVRLGLEARDQGNWDEAETRLGRAVQRATADGNDEMITKLSRVVDIIDADQGTVVWRDNATKGDAMDLDIASTVTIRS